MDNPLFRVVGTFGDRALIEFENKVVPCLIRTKKQTVVTNDFVTIDEKSKPILATDIKKRENVFIRQNKTKQKVVLKLQHLLDAVSIF